MWNVTFLPCLSSLMAVSALVAAGADRGANRWFTCANGHPFAIGECGGAMMESKCPVRAQHRMAHLPPEHERNIPTQLC